MKPTLWLLKPNFPDPGVGPGLYFCPHCAAVEGILAYFPEVRERLIVRHIDFPRPRHEVIAEIGVDHQACPVLILPADWPEVQKGARQSMGRSFFVGEHEIASFLAEWAGTALPHP